MTPREEWFNLVGAELTYSLTYKELCFAAWEASCKEERDRVLEIVRNQPYYPDTNVGMRQQWIKDEIIRKIEGGVL